jgi:Clp amino terminal domain, pathogenicity island component
MLHDGGWPVSAISGLVDLARAEAAVRGILNSPGYSAPPSSRGFGALATMVPGFRNGYMGPSWGVGVAVKRGDSYLGVDHALLAMIRNRETVPARALAGLADLDTLDAAVVEAMNAPVVPAEDAVFLPEGQQLDSPLSRAIVDALSEDATFGFDGADGRLDRPSTRRGYRSARAIPARPPASPVASAGRHTGTRRLHMITGNKAAVRPSLRPAVPRVVGGAADGGRRHRGGATTATPTQSRTSFSASLGTTKDARKIGKSLFPVHRKATISSSAASKV